MKKSLLTLTAAIMAVSMSITSWAMTAEEVTAKNPTSYTAGTNSVYGSALNQDQLNAVAQATADFMTANITDSMDTDQKIKAAYDYIKNRTTYIDWNAVTGANTAYTLVTGQGACSGMCRSMKALCDAMGVECYHVHSTGNDHQWNLIRYGDGILYHVDIDANKSAGQDVIYKSLTHPLPFDTSVYPAVGQVQEQTQANGIRAWQDGAKLLLGIHEEERPIYKSEYHNGECSIIDKTVNSFLFQSAISNVNSDGHEVWIYGVTTINGNAVALGEPKVYQLEYDKDYNFDFTGNHQDAISLSQYCIDNDITIIVDVVDRTKTGADGKTSRGWNIRYATENSVKTGEIGQ